MKSSVLFLKTLAGILFLFGIVILVTSVFFGLTINELATREYKSKGSSIASSIASSSVETLLNQNAETLQSIIDQFLEIEGVSYVYILDDQDEIVAHTFAPSIPVQIVQLYEKKEDETIVQREKVKIEDIHIAEMGDIMDISSPILAGIGGHVHVGMNYSTIRRQVSAAVKTQVILVGIVFLFGIGIAYLFVNHVSRPMMILAGHAQRLASDEHPDYIGFGRELRKLTQRKDEVGQLGNVLQHMMARIHERETGLKAAQSELKRINENLEGLVKERTQELNEKNQLLETQRDNLEQAYENLKHTQNQLIQSEKMAALGQLIAGIAHEINTPLGAIRSSVLNMSKTLEQTLGTLPEFFRVLSDDHQRDFFALVKKPLQKHMPLSSKEERKIRRDMIRMLNEENIHQADTLADTLVDMGVYDYQPFMSLLSDPENVKIVQMAYKLSGLQRSASNISIATERASEIVFALKSYARYDFSGELVETDVTEGIETVLTLYYNQFKHGVEVVRNYQAVPPIRCYPDELNQVWTNLIHNGLQAMENKGTLTIDVFERDGRVIIAITDSGRGIPDDIVHKIFDPFFTTKPLGEGSGLGLDIVRKIIDKHHGDIKVESKPGHTTFSVILPMNPNEVDDET